MGMVKFLPEGDRYSMKYKEFTSQLAVAMGGRVAEEISFGKDNITSGASSDIQQPTKLAKAMVPQLGHSDELGIAPYPHHQQHPLPRPSLRRPHNLPNTPSPH